MTDDQIEPYYTHIEEKYIVNDKTIQILKSFIEHPWWFQWLIIHLPTRGT